jgi:hypothetical protein
MGLSEIKVILETLQRACTEAESDGKRDIISVLSKPEVCLPYKLSNQS